jgi:hypothetical protein
MQLLLNFLEFSLKIVMGYWKGSIRLALCCLPGMSLVAVKVMLEKLVDEPYTLKNVMRFLASLLVSILLFFLHHFWKTHREAFCY